ncbi:protein MobC, partial [uncultured Desulfovibrio sp.]|uniref:protein MobC n=1 Tax=uncultured Desulfovibrio sp. TaxID=167968 RepID=UPI0026277478
ATVTLDGNRAMTVKQAIFSLALTLERMKKRGFDTQEIVEKLHEKGIEVKHQTLTKYLTEARRQREGRKTQKRDTPSPTAAKIEGIARRQDDNNQQSQGTGGGFTISPDTPLDEL